MVGSKFFTDDVIVYRSTIAKGVGGEIVETYSTYITIRGSFQNASGNWNESNEIEAYRKTKTFFCDIMDITDRDYLYYGGKTFEIVNVSNIAGHHLEINLQSRSTS
jgi:hypothetical protein